MGLGVQLHMQAAHAGLAATAAMHVFVATGLVLRGLLRACVRAFEIHHALPFLKMARRMLRGVMLSGRRTSRSSGP